ncbi:hypothetical protein MY1884_000389 [Beauveria asiatica]
MAPAPGTPTIYQQSQPTGGPRRSLIRLIRHRAILRAWKKYIAGRGARRLASIRDHAVQDDKFGKRYS